MIPTERLRAAARVLRERAEDAATAHGIDWFASDDALYRVQTETADGRRGETHSCSACGGIASTAEETAAYIATMHPPVALALADWLDAEAQDRSHDPGEHDGSPSGYALAVADAVLGGGSDADA